MYQQQQLHHPHPPPLPRMDSLTDPGPNSLQLGLSEMHHSGLLLEDSSSVDQMESNNNYSETTRQCESECSNSIVGKTGRGSTSSGSDSRRPRYDTSAWYMPPPPPPRLDVACLVREGNQSRVPMLEELKGNYEELCTELIQSVKEDLQKRLQMRKENEERRRMEAEIEVLKKQSEQAKHAYAAQVKANKDELSKLRVEREKIYRRLDKKKKVLKRLENLDRNRREKLANAEAKLKAVAEENEELNKWFHKVGMKLYMCCPDESNSSRESEAGGESDIVIEMFNINPNDPDELFRILMNKMSSTDGTFVASAVCPSFDEAYEIIQEANESQNFIAFMINCKKHWIKEIMKRGVAPAKNQKQEESPPKPPSESDITKPLFESPSSEEGEK